MYLVVLFGCILLKMIVFYQNLSKSHKISFKIKGGQNIEFDIIKAFNTLILKAFQVVRVVLQHLSKKVRKIKDFGQSTSSVYP